MDNGGGGKSSDGEVFLKKMHYDLRIRVSYIIMQLGLPRYT
jgi:hypothetical protein